MSEEGKRPKNPKPANKENRTDGVPAKRKPPARKAAPAAAKKAAAPKPDAHQPEKEHIPAAKAEAKPGEASMEVHHHPDIEKKGLKEYLLEGLMIFVAVMMGFIAENIREGISNRHKEHEMIVTLATELKKDTTALHYLVDQYLPVHNQWVDSANLYVRTQPIKGNERKILAALFNASIWDLYSPPDVTVNEIKSTGNFDLIGSEDVKRAILAYSSRVDQYVKSSTFLSNVQHSVDTAMVSVIDESQLQKILAGAYTKISKGNSGFINENDLPENITFTTYNKTAFLILDRRIDQADNQVNDVFGWLPQLLNEERNLLKLLQDEYGLDNLSPRD